jgi:hypothetical protein
MNRPITFNGLNLQNGAYKTLKIKGIDEQRQVETDAPRASISSGSFIRDKKFDSKVIAITLMVFGTSISDVEQKIDELKGKIFKGVKGNLDIEFAGATRRWVATVEDVRNTRFRGLTREFEIEFKSEGFGFAPEAITASLTSQTGALVEYTLDVLGTTQAQPIYTIIINSSTDLTKILIRNKTLNRAIEIDTAFPATGEVIVDTRSGKERVLVEGTGFTPDGVFPYANVGENELEFEFVSTAHNVDIDINYNKLYL